MIDEPYMRLCVGWGELGKLVGRSISVEGTAMEQANGNNTLNQNSHKWNGKRKELNG